MSPFDNNTYTLTNPYVDIDSNKPLFFPCTETYERKNKKIGRNDPCNCGSGNKNKKCCNTK